MGSLIDIEPVLDLFSASSSSGYVEPLEGLDSACDDLDGTVPALRLHIALTASTWSEDPEDLTFFIPMGSVRRMQPMPVLRQSGSVIRMVWVDNPQTWLHPYEDMESDNQPRYAPVPGLELLFAFELSPHGMASAGNPFLVDAEGKLVDDPSRQCAPAPDLDGMELAEWLAMLREARSETPLTENHLTSLRPATYCPSLTAPDTDFEDEDEELGPDDL